MVYAEGDTLPGLEPAEQVPDLPMLLGEISNSAGYLVAVADLLKLLENLAIEYPVEALGASLIVQENVLVPRSQPLIHLLRQALAAVAPVLPQAPAVLDMGCGSGVCALLAAQVMPGARVTATDHLPEAVATTRLNVERFVAGGMVRPGAVTAAEPGDLFETLGAAAYDLIIFNAPWVAAPARNRAETALNDAGQQTVRRFLVGAAQRLNNGGRVILGYADHSGPNAIVRLEQFISDAGLAVRRRHTDRIKTHRQNRAWQAIYAYELAHA
jgi:methylase of polypeptide subunit release factors